MKSVFLLVDSIINIYIWLIIINAILSWLVAFNVLNTQNRFVFTVLNATHQLTDPVLNKIRRFIPNLGSIDISPVVLILLLIFFLNRLLYFSRLKISPTNIFSGLQIYWKIFYQKLERVQYGYIYLKIYYRKSIKCVFMDYYELLL